MTNRVMEAGVGGILEMAAGLEVPASVEVTSAMVRACVDTPVTQATGQVTGTIHRLQSTPPILPLGRFNPNIFKLLLQLFSHSRRDVEGWSRPGNYTRDTERDRTDYYSKDNRDRRGGGGQYYDTDMESVVSTSALYKKQHPTTSGGSTVQFSGKTSATAQPTSTTTTSSAAATTHPKSILRQTTVLSNADSERNDGSLSDTALGGPGISSIHNKNANGGMGQKSSSTSQLSDTGRQRRLGLIGAKRTRITVHRSEEVIPCNISVDKRLIRQGTSVSSDGDTDIFPAEPAAENWLTTISRENQLSEFIEGTNQKYFPSTKYFLLRSRARAVGRKTGVRIPSIGRHTVESL